MRERGALRLTVNRTPRHIYAQVISSAGDRVLAAASTLDQSLRSCSFPCVYSLLPGILIVSLSSREASLFTASHIASLSELAG